MTWVASAPGKLVVLGEYAVLDGATALVMAVDRRARAWIRPVSLARSRLCCRMPDASTTESLPGSPTGSELVDTVLNARDFGRISGAWEAEIDSRAFFADGCKLGLGSSAAALVAFAGALSAETGTGDAPAIDRLIACHRAFQGGTGSGIDVAAARLGGVLQFALDETGQAQIGSVRLPKSVGFASVFAGGSASTPDLVGRYRRFVETGSSGALALVDRMSAVAAAGCAAARDEDDSAFVTAIDAYGRCIADLGRAVGVDLVTAAHRQIGALATELGLAYKVSGAGGGDVGFACGIDFDALRDFSRRASERGFRVVELSVDDQGLEIEERAA